jgi:hypothetical protein
MEKNLDTKVQHIDEKGHNVVLSSDTRSDKVWNPLLILSCVAFGCTSILFGYDDKVISPVAAMVPFVSIRKPRIDAPADLLVGGQIPGQERRLGRLRPDSEEPRPRLLSASGRSHPRSDRRHSTDDTLRSKMGRRNGVFSVLRWHSKSILGLT